MVEPPSCAAWSPAFNCHRLQTQNGEAFRQCLYRGDKSKLQEFKPLGDLTPILPYSQRKHEKRINADSEFKFAKEDIHAVPSSKEEGDDFTQRDRASPRTRRARSEAKG